MFNGHFTEEMHNINFFKKIWKFTKIKHILGHKSDVNIFYRTEIIHSISYDPKDSRKYSDLDEQKEMKNISEYYHNSI